MKNRILLLFGLAIPLVFTASILGLATLVDGYSHLSQTVSEIGQTGSPAESLWEIANVFLALCFLLYAWGLFCFCQLNSYPRFPAYLVGFFGLMSISIAIFESPHPLHNVFGLLMTFGYMAPLALALSWRRRKEANSLVKFSWVIWALILITMFLNLSPLFTRDLFPLEYYGLVQRSLFLVFHGLWCPVVGLTLYRASRPFDMLQTETKTDISHA